MDTNMSQIRAEEPLEDTLSVADVAAITMSDVLCVYFGKAGCRCGCGGEYRYNPLHPWVKLGKDPNRGYPITDPKEISQRTVTRVLNRVKSHVATGRTFTSLVPVNPKFETFVDIQVESGRCYTVYLRPLESR